MTPLEILEFYEGSIEREEGKEPYVTINADDYAAVLTGFREAVEERDRYRESLERIRLRAAPGPDDRNFDRCIQDLMWCDDEARLALALTERSNEA